MPNLAREKLVRRRRAALLIVAVTLLAAVGLYLTLAADPSPKGLADAGSSDIIAPIGQVQLVAAMDPPDGFDGLDLEGRDPATIPDSRVQVDIAVKLDQMGLPVEPLDITVDSGLVTLEGRVEDMLLRDAIEVTVRSVQGVREVRNNIEVIGGQ